MKNISDVARAGLGLCVAVAILGGCGGSGQFPSRTTQAPLGRVRLGSSGDEVLQGKIHTHCKYHGGLFTTCSFHTIRPGKATGPYPGTFTAEGGSRQGATQGQSSFGESFTIVSGSSKITGGVFTPPFGSGLQYTSSIGNGYAELNEDSKRHLIVTLEAF
jgi:hypothetical protein